MRSWREPSKHRASTQIDSGDVVEACEHKFNQESLAGDKLHAIAGKKMSRINHNRQFHFATKVYDLPFRHTIARDGRAMRVTAANSKSKSESFGPIVIARDVDLQVVQGRNRVHPRMLGNVQSA